MSWFKHFALFSLSKGKANWDQSTFSLYEKKKKGNEEFEREDAVATYVIAAILS